MDKDEIKANSLHPLRTARKHDTGIVYELSSDDETSDKNKPGVGLGEVISLDDDPEPTSSKKIAITIEDTPTKRVTKSTKITIQIEDSEGSSGCQIESEVQIGTDITSNNGCQRGLDVKNRNTRQRKSHVTDSFQKISEITPINVCKRGISCTEEQINNATDEPTEKIRRVNLISQPKANDEIFNKMRETTKNEKADKCKNEIVGEELKTEKAFVQCYVDFMDACSKIDNSEDMKHILEKKVKHYYRKAEESYVNSKEFEQMILKSIEKVNSEPFKIWVHIKAVVDMLRDRKKSRNIDPESSLINNPRKLKQIEDLEKTLRTLQELVERLEDADVNFDDEDQSAYLKADKYKARLVSVHARLCKLRGAHASSYSRVRLERRAGRAGGPAAALEEWVNRPVASGQPPRFPDFHDVVECVRQACRSDSLHWSDAQVMKEARELFTRCGRALQKMRQRREWRLAESRLQCGDGGLNEDPAESSAELQAQLTRNRTIARQREQQVFDEFENRQMFGKTECKDDSDPDITEESSKTAQESNAVSEENEISSKESNKKTKECSEAETSNPETAAVTNVLTQALQNSDSKLKDNNKGVTQKDDLSESKQLTGDKDISEVQDAPLLLVRDTKAVKEDTECAVISSDEEDSSDDSDSSTDSVMILSDGEEERCAVSDSSVGSGEDELHLLRRVEMRRRGGVRYSTSVSHVRNSSHSDDSDTSACILIDSHDEDDVSAISPHTNK